MNKIQNAVSWAVRGIVSCAILYYLFLKIPFADVMGSLSKAQLMWLSLGLVSQIIMIFINALQMKIFVHQQKMDLTAPLLIKINFITFFYKLFLPGELVAGIIRWQKMSKPGGMRAQALACMILSRIINIFTLALIGLIFFFIEKPYDNSYTSESIFIGFLGSFLLFLSITSPSLSPHIENVAQRLNFLWVPDFLKEKITKIWRSIKIFHIVSLNQKFYILTLSVFFHFLQIFSLFFFMRSLSINMSIISIAWITAAVFFLQMLPVSISGLGIREGAFVFFLKKYGVPGSDAIALSLLIFAVSIAFACVGGICEASDYFKQNKIKGEH